MTMSLPGLRAGLTDAIPAHLRGAGFGAFNLAAVIGGQAAAPLIVGAISAAFDDNLRVAFLAVTPLSFLGAAILFRARKFLDEDMNKIMMAVLHGHAGRAGAAGRGGGKRWSGPRNAHLIGCPLLSAVDRHWQTLSDAYGT